MSRGAFRGWVAVAASVAVCLLAAVAAPAAQAGTIWVTDGAGSCNAFSVYGESGSFIVPSSCPMSIQACACDPAGQNGYWMTTAPPGITINQAWTANGDVNAGGWTTGVVDRGLLAERQHRRVGRIDAGAGPAVVQHRPRGQREHQQPDLRHPDRLHPEQLEFRRLCFEQSAVVHGLRDRTRGHRELAAVRDRAGRAVVERIVRVESAGR